MADMTNGRDDVPVVSVHSVNILRQRVQTANTVTIVQQALIKLGFPVLLSSIWSPETQAAYDGFRRSIGYTGADAAGSVGLKSLTALAAKTRTFEAVA